MVTGNANLVKEINLNKVREILKKERTATKPQLAELTGLSVVTINSLVKVLLESGEITQDVIVSSNGGRPAASYKFNAEFNLILSIYMHEYNTKDTVFIRVVNLLGEIIEKKQDTISRVNKNSFNVYIEKMLLKYPQIKVICFGMPGEQVDGAMLISDYKELENEYFIKYISDKFNINVIFENDINAAVEGYCYSNKVSKEKSVIGIYFPSKYPPGAGIYINGEIYKGRNGLAGEFKYLPMGIDWDTFSYSEDDMKELIIKSVLSFNCMYNPDFIILYGECIKEEIINEIKERCISEVEKAMIPDIIISKELNKDFEIGIGQIALKNLNNGNIINIK